MNRVFWITVLLAGVSSPVMGQEPPRAGTRVESDVVYGMYSGLALLMDVYHPKEPNGYGVISIPGSAWHMPLAYDSPQLKSRGQTIAKRLVEGGYTVFVINHRAAPRFRHPAAVEDAQRAVRFVRYHAKKYVVRPDRLGAAGWSSGGHLALMLGVLNGKGDPDDPDPVNRESAKVQCVAAGAAPADFVNVEPRPMQISYLGTPPGPGGRALPGTAEYKVYREASPVTHATKDDPPCLLIHGDADTVVSFKHSELMKEALTKAGVTAELMRIKGSEHSPPFPKESSSEAIRWFDKHLRGK
jgi:acetyl esterase/lipase